MKQDIESETVSIAGCYLGFSGGVQSVYFTAGFLKVLAQERFPVRGIVATEFPALSSVWYLARLSPFDVEWSATKFFLSAVELGRWNRSEKPTPMEKWVTAQVAPKYFSDLKAPFTIYWHDRMAHKLILSSKGTLKEPLLAALSMQKTTADRNQGSGNEMAVLPEEAFFALGPERRWVIVDVREHLTGSDFSDDAWNGWRSLISEAVQARGRDKKVRLVTKNLSVANLFDSNGARRLFREGEDLARSEIRAITEFCKDLP